MNDPSKFRSLVASKLSELDTTYQGSPARDAYGALYKKAAVLSYFEPTAIRSSQAEEKTTELFDLLADSNLRTDASGQNRWILDVPVRKKILRQLGSRDDVLRTLHSIEHRPKDITQIMLEQYLLGEAKPLELQNRHELIASLEIATWFDKVLEEVPGPQRVRRHLDRTDLLAPFQRLAGEHFRGRETELNKLGDYVGVLDASSTFEAAKRGFRSIFNIEEKPPLMIHGPGGIGKSSLIARFILNHAYLDESQRFPFVYIDFDRPGILAEEPTTLLLEAAQQLSIQYPDERSHLEALHREWHQALSSMTGKGSTSRSGLENRFAEQLGRLLSTMHLNEKPLLFVLDTFEVVQHRGQRFVKTIGDFLQVLQRSWPLLRTVVVGRAPVNAFPFRVDLYPLGDLDEQATCGFLETHGIAPSLAKKWATRLGGNPLTLRLAMEVWNQMGEEGLKGIDREKLFLFKLKPHKIQGQLYQRLLDHIKDGDVRKLAHPGLVLRRITPALIQHVLAIPCQLQVSTPEQAEDLYERLKQDVTLVETDSDGILRHRADVRQVMVQNLADDKPDLVTDIHQRAVAYYQQYGTTPIERAEELYHRLALGDPSEVLDARWMEGVAGHLTSAVEELDAQARVYLASRIKDVQVGEKDENLAELQVWERLIATRVRDLVEMGQFEDAYKELRARSARSPNSPLHRYDVTVRMALGQWDEAALIVDRALTGLYETGSNLGLLFHLLVQRMQLADQRQEWENGESSMVRFLREARHVAEATQDSLIHFEAGLYCLSMQGPDCSMTAEGLQTLYLSLPLERLNKRPELSIHAGATLIVDEKDARQRNLHQRVLARVVQVAGLHGVDGRQRRALARALSTWDESRSAQAREMDHPKEPVSYTGAQVENDPKETWLRLAEPEMTSRFEYMLVEVLMNEEMPASVLDRLKQIYSILHKERGARSVQIKQPDKPLAQSSSKVILDLSDGDARKLHGYIADAFSLDELALILRSELDKSLYALTPSDASADTSVALILEQARSEGWVIPLLVALLQARPNQAGLQQLAQKLGLASLDPHETNLERILSEANSSIDPSHWREKLGELEPQICRVEVNHSKGFLYATGFLVGPDLLLTTYHAVEDLVHERIDPDEVILRFDYRTVERDGKEQILNAGTEFFLAADWLVASSPVNADDALNFALLRVDGSPGEEPIGGGESAATGRTRGWIDLPEEEPAYEQLRGLYILHYPQARPLTLIFSTSTRVQLNANRNRIRYRMATEPGSSGAPCFDVNLNLIGIHESAQGNEVEGIPIMAIVQFMKAQDSSNLESFS